MTGEAPAGANIELLLVGPVGRATGGIARYIAEQRRHLSDRVEITTHDTGALAGSREGTLAGVAVRSVVNLCRYPFRSPADLVHVHTAEYVSFYRNALYVLYASYVWRRPVVLHVHGPVFDEFVADASLPVRLLQRLVFSASDAVIVLSEHWREALEPYVPSESLLVLPNAIDPGDYEPKARGDVPELVFVADHVRRKGIADLAEALADLATRRPGEFRATIGGTGPLAAHAERVADDHAEVEYRGYLTESEKRELLDRASIYVLPTYAEGLPIGILEAMAGGNAIVSTAVGSIPGLVDPETGIVLEPGDPAALADALEELVGAPDRVESMGRAARAVVEESYTWSRIGDRLVDLYGTLLAGESPTTVGGIDAEHDRRGDR